MVFLLEHGMIVVILFDDFKKELAVLRVIEAKVEGYFVFTEVFIGCQFFLGEILDGEVLVGPN